MMFNPALTWFEHVWNPVGTACARECCAMFVVRRDLSVLVHLPPATRVLVGPSDLFGAHVPDNVIRDIFVLMARHPEIQFRVLTRNPNRMEQWFGCWAASEIQEWTGQMGVSYPLDRKSVV